MANNLRRIWDTDPDAKPKPRSGFSNDVVGRFRSGRMVGKLPEALDAWRVTTGDPDVAMKIAALFGGFPEEWDTDKEDNTEILTDASSVRVIIESSADIDASMKLFGSNGLIHHCDGVEFLSPDEDKGTPCGCPGSFQERKDKAKSGRGPKPSVDIKFKLADAPKLGYFRFNSGSWELVKFLHEVIEAVDTTGGADEDGKGGSPVVATLAIEHVAYTTKAGRDVAFNKPAVKVIGIAADTGFAPDLAKAA
jgi:recombination directionality factor gp3-like protein